MRLRSWNPVMTPERAIRYADSSGLQIAYQVEGNGPLEDRGEQTLKGVTEPWHVFVARGGVLC
jgi:hypothetical protein